MTSDEGKTKSQPTPKAATTAGEGAAKPEGRFPTTPGTMKTSPKKRKLCNVAMARCASKRSIDRSQGRM